MKAIRSHKHIVAIIMLVVVGLIVAAGFVFLQGVMKPASAPSATTEQIIEDPPAIAPFRVASDETLGSGLAVTYPNEWTNAHTGAQQPQSATQAQIDENIITSPSGKIQVVLRVQTLTQTGGACHDGYIKLKYLKTDTSALPEYSEGRFAAYVVYFPDFNVYQYHVGLQKNTEAIRGVNLENNAACPFMFSEFIARNSSLPNVPQTTTTLSITFVDLVSKGQDLKPGIDETNVAEKLSGSEYEQAKAIVQSVHILEPTDRSDR